MGPENAAADNAARPQQSTITTPRYGVVLIGRLRQLSVREYADRNGNTIEAVDALILAGNSTYKVELGNQLRSKELTGHVAPWNCDEESPGDRVQLRVAIRAATSKNGAFLSWRAVTE